MKKEQGTSCSFERDQMTYSKDKSSSKGSEQILNDPTISVMDINHIPN